MANHPTVVTCQVTKPERGEEEPAATAAGLCMILCKCHHGVHNQCSSSPFRSLDKRETGGISTNMKREGLTRTLLLLMKCMDISEITIDA